MGWFQRAKNADANYSLAGWAWEAAKWVAPGSVAGLVGWAASYRDWIWNDYGMLGVMSVGLAAALIASIAIAVTGIGVRAWRGGHHKPEMMEPLTTLAPTTPTSSVYVLSQPPKSKLISTERFYSRAEKERIVDTINFIQERFANGQRLTWEAEKIASNPGQNAAIDNSIAKIEAILVEAEQLNIDLDKIRSESRSYPVDFALLLAAKPVYSDEFQRAVYDYSNALYVYRHLLPEGAHRGAVAKVLDSAKRHLSRAKYAFEKWMGDCDEEMRAARRSLDK
jgi:hypothetical protein